MPITVITLGENIAATGPGEAKGVSLERSGVFRLTGTFVGTVALQGSLDGSAWDTVASATNTTAQYFQDRPYPNWRFNCTAYTSGTITKAMLGAV